MIFRVGGLSDVFVRSQSGAHAMEIGSEIDRFTPFLT